MLFQKRCQPNVWEFYRRAKKIGNSKLNFRPFKVWMLFHKGKFLQKFSILKTSKEKHCTALQQYKNITCTALDQGSWSKADKILFLDGQL